MNRSLNVLSVTAIVVCVFCSGIAVAEEQRVSDGETRAIELGGHTFNVPASLADFENSSAFLEARDRIAERFSGHAPLSIVGNRVAQDTQITPGAISRAVTDGYRTMRIPIVGSTADIQDPQPGQRAITGNKLMEYRAAEGTQPAGWVDITNEGARVDNVACNVTINGVTAALPVVDKKPSGAPASGESTRVVYRNMVYEWQPGTGDEQGKWKNITYSIVPASQVEGGSYEQAILVNGERVSVPVVSTLPAAEGSEYVVMGSKVYQWNDSTDKYVAVEAGTGEDEHPKIITGSVTATVQMPNGTEVNDVPVYDTIPSTAGADDGDLCIVRDPRNGRDSVYSYDAESKAWERSTRLYVPAATVDRSSFTADVTIDGVAHQDVPVVTHLPREYTQGQDIIVVQNFIGNERVYQWNEQSKSWKRVDGAAELGRVYQEFTVKLSGGDFTGSAPLVPSTGDIKHPREGQVVAVTDATGIADKLYRYEKGQWKLLYEF